MRVALVSSLLPPDGTGGAEAYVARLARSLRDRHEILLVSGSPATDVDGVRHATVPHLRPVAHGAPTPTKLLWHARDQWRPSVHVAVRRQLRAFAPDVVHTHELQGLSAAPFTAIRATPAPHVHTAHDLNLLCVRTSMTRDGAPCGGRCRDCAIQRFVRGGAVRRHVAYLLGVSDFITTRHVEAGIVPAERGVTIRLAADAGHLARRQPAPGALRAGYIGTLAAHKGIRTLLRAFDRAPAGWSLTVAGDGPLAGEVTGDRVAYLGRVEGDAKEAFFAGIDVLVVPSEWEEPGATVVFEAAVRGIPALVSDRGGLPELPEVTVFAAGDVDALLRGLESMPERLGALSDRLVARHREFLWETHVERVEAVLARAAGSPA